MLAADVRCPKHPDVPASGTCGRCGTFICPQDTSLVDQVAYCTPCSTRPDVDWVETYRHTLLGKRSSTEWIMLLGVLAQTLYGGAALFIAFTRPAERTRSVPLALLMFASAANGVGWFLGKRLNRELHKVLVAVWAVVFLVGFWSSSSAAALIPMVLLVGVASAPLLSVPSQLFFRMPVPREKVITTYKQLEDNRAARWGVGFAVLGFFLPPLAVMALISGGIGLKRVDPNGKPPVGGKARAIAALVLGVIGLAVSTPLWWNALAHRR